MCWPPVRLCDSPHASTRVDFAQISQFGISHDPADYRDLPPAAPRPQGRKRLSLYPGGKSELSFRNGRADVSDAECMLASFFLAYGSEHYCCVSAPLNLHCVQGFESEAPPEQRKQGVRILAPSGGGKVSVSMNSNDTELFQRGRCVQLDCIAFHGSPALASHCYCALSTGSLRRSINSHRIFR